MSASPFHGIFGALRDHADERTSLSLESDDGFAQTQSQGQAGRLAVDIYEQDDYYIIKALLAGARMSDLDIEVEGSTIIIRGIRRNSDTIPQDKYYLQECYYGEFSRSVKLPFLVDARKIRATFNKDCILKILIPKEDRVKVIKVNEA